MHRFVNFKNIAEAEINLFSPVTILIGRNGSGKTNVIEGVELLANLAQGVPLHEITDIGRGGKFELRGGLDACPHFGKDKFKLEFNNATVIFKRQSRPIEYQMEIAFTDRGGACIVAEKLTIGKYLIFDAKLEGGLLKVTYNNFARGGNNPTHKMSSERSVLSRYRDIANLRPGKNKKMADALKVTMVIGTYLATAYIFDLQSKSMRGYERIGALSLWRNGGNLSSVLYHLSEQSQNTLARIVSIVNQIPDEPFVDIAFIVTEQNDVLMGFYTDKKKSRIVDARLLSDGTLRALGVLVAMETAPKHSRIIIEEFDNGLHPSRANLLIKALFERAQQRKLNILVTTHNPAFMNALNEEQMSQVVLCHCSKNGSTKLTKFNDLPNAEVLQLQGGLGDLVTRGTIDKYLSPRFSEEQKRAMEKWLATLP